MKQLKQILSQFTDDDEVAIRLFGGGLAAIKCLASQVKCFINKKMEENLKTQKNKGN